MLDHALMLMVIAFVLNYRGDGRLVAGIYLIASLMTGYMLEHTASVESFAIYAMGELLLIHLMCSIENRSRLISDMINISRLSIAVQLIGAVLWIEYYQTDVYITLCEIVFSLQILRMLWHGLATREATNCFSGSMDTLYFSYSGKKL